MLMESAGLSYVKLQSQFGCQALPQMNWRLLCWYSASATSEVYSHAHVHVLSPVLLSEATLSKSEVAVMFTVVKP